MPTFKIPLQKRGTFLFFCVSPSTLIWAHIRLLYDPFRPRIWQSPSKQIATPFGVERTTIPSAFIKLWAPVSCLILSLVTVSSTWHRVPMENLSVAFRKAPAADISLVCNSNISVLCEEFIVSLTGSSNWNLSYLRRSFIN